MTAIARALWNPIVAKEYRSRMRTWKSPLAMTVYIVLLAGLGWAVFASMAVGSSFGLFGSPGSLGPTLFGVLIVFQVALLAFITPALTAGAISGERERQTIDLLFVTRIPPFSIVWGKLLASMSFVVLLLVLSVPIFSLVFLFGGIELDQVVAAFLVTAVTALTLGLMGLAFSTLFRRTLAATVAAYGAGFVLIVGTLIVGELFPTTYGPSASTVPAPPAVTYLSPIIPLFSIASNYPVQSIGYGVRPDQNGYATPFNGPGTVCQSSTNGQTVCYGGGPSGVVTKGGPVSGYGPQQVSGTTIPTGLFSGWQYWQATVVMQLAICAVALAISALLLPPVRKLPWSRRPAAAQPSGAPAKP